MKIDILKSRREREKRELNNMPWYAWPLLPLFPFVILAVLAAAAFTLLHDYVRGKHLCLFVDCTPEQTIAVQFSLKTALDIPYVEFQPLERRIPGPVFTGSREALEWLAKELRAANVPCRVRRVLPKTANKVYPFYYPSAHNLSAAAAYHDSRQQYLQYANAPNSRRFVLLK